MKIILWPPLGIQFSIAYYSLTDHPGRPTLYTILVKRFSKCHLTFQPPLACQNSSPEIISHRMKFKNWNFSISKRHYFILIHQYLFNGTSSDPQICSILVSKLYSHLVLGHSSLIIYWCSPSTFCILYFHPYLFHWYSLILSLLIAISSWPVAQRLNSSSKLRDRWFTAGAADG